MSFYFVTTGWIFEIGFCEATPLHILPGSQATALREKTADFLMQLQRRIICAALARDLVGCLVLSPILDVNPTQSYFAGPSLG